MNGIPTTDDTITSTGLEEQDENRLGEITGMVRDQEASIQSSETIGVEQDADPDKTTGVDQVEELEDSDDESTEQVKYVKAKQLGIEAAHDDDRTLPKRIRKKRKIELYE